MSKFYSDERCFLYEVFLPNIYGSRVNLKVPFKRMNTKTREISSQKGKIICILPATLKRYDPQLNLAWWIQIVTNSPKFIYFFGPFSTQKEAKYFQPDYVEDLISEKAIIVDVSLKYCQPISITIEL